MQHTAPLRPQHIRRAWHVHEYFEILLCREGHFRLETGDAPVFLDVGDMAVIDPMDVHCTYALAEGDNTYMVLKFVPELMYSSEQPMYELGTVSAYMRLRSSHRKVFRKDEVESSGMGAIMERIFDEYNNKEFGYALSVRAEIMRLFVAILRDWHKLTLPSCPTRNRLRSFSARMSSSRPTMRAM